MPQVSICLANRSKSCYVDSNKETAQRIDLDALDKLSKLFKCEVADILEYRPDEQ